MKAFDTVNHRILISKLHKYGIRGHILQWFESYLKNRKQIVRIKNFKSQIKAITCGVPQGSILGPLLFILYKNDLANVSNVLFPILFADDTSVYLEADKESNLIKTLNEELAKLNIWLNANKLKINIDERICYGLSILNISYLPYAIINELSFLKHFYIPKN